MKKGINKFGFSLIEMLIVISVLGLFSLIGSNLLFGTLFGSSKSEVLKEVRQNGEYALRVMEETIKTSVGLISCSPSSVVVKGKNNLRTNFSLKEGRIASNSSYLTNNKVKIENFEFDCSEVKPGLPPKIGISFVVSQAQKTNRPEKKARMSFSSWVTMRNY